MKKTKTAKSRTITCTMSLWVKKFGLISGLALLFYACEDSGDIGLELNPERASLVTRYAEIPVKTSVVQVDSLNTTNTYTGLVGSYSDTNLGDIEATFYSRILPDKNTLFDPKDTDNQFDSLVLTLHIKSLYGRELGNESYSIHELTESIEQDRVYYSSDQTSYETDPIGLLSFDASAIDTTKIDTVILRTRLDDAFGNKLFDEAKDTTSLSYDSLHYFLQFCHGIAIVPQDSKVILGFKPEDAEYDTKLSLYYHNSKDTAQLTYYFTGYQVEDSLYINYKHYYHSIIQDKSGTPLAGLTELNKDFDTGTDYTYIQSGTGVLTKISFDPYYDFLDTLSNVVINRAELEFSVEHYDDNVFPPSGLFLAVTDESNKFLFQTNSSGGVEIKRLTDAFSGYKNYKLGFFKIPDENSGLFRSQITGHILSLTEGTGVNKPLFLESNHFVNSIESFVSSKNSMKLKIYYSTVR